MERSPHFRVASSSPILCSMRECARRRVCNELATHGSVAAYISRVSSFEAFELWQENFVHVNLPGLTRTKCSAGGREYLISRSHPEAPQRLATKHAARQSRVLQWHESAVALPFRAAQSPLLTRRCSKSMASDHHPASFQGQDPPSLRIDLHARGSILAHPFS